MQCKPLAVVAKYFHCGRYNKLSCMVLKQAIVSYELANLADVKSAFALI